MKTAAAIPVLMYHHVSPSPGLVTISPENFRAQMRWLAGHGWRSIGCDDLARFIAGEPLPEKSVLLTFDDGYLDNWIYAHPVLDEFGLHAALFVVTGHIGNGPARNCAGDGAPPATPNHNACKAAIAAGCADEVMLRWSEIERMRAAGTFEFHSHTHTHTRWDQVESGPERRSELLIDDLDRSRAALQERLGRATPHLCWPQGYYDAAYVAAARGCGFTHLYTVEHGSVLPHADPGRIRRIVTKDRGARWLGSRLAIYRRPWLARIYERRG
jgi:peptidoglycan/xylan/chitin deacetylase (PgdA/CDA1 family)